MKTSPEFLFLFLCVGFVVTTSTLFGYGVGTSANKCPAAVEVSK